MRLHFQTGKLLKYSWDGLENFNFNWNIRIVLIGYSNKLISLRLFKGSEFEIDKYHYILIFNKIIGRDWNRSNECRAMYEIMHEITRESKKRMKCFQKLYRDKAKQYKDEITRIIKLSLFDQRKYLHCNVVSSAMIISIGWPFIFLHRRRKCENCVVDDV